MNQKFEALFADMLGDRPALELALSEMRRQGKANTELYAKTRSALALLDNPAELRRRLKQMVPDGVIRLDPEAAALLRRKGGR
jgi:hypothetical protein